jgi:hypothetical protein
MVKKFRPRLNGEGDSDDDSQRRNHPGRHARRRMDRDLGADRCAGGRFTQLVRNAPDLKMYGDSSKLAESRVLVTSPRH